MPPPPSAPSAEDDDSASRPASLLDYAALYAAYDAHVDEEARANRIRQDPRDAFARLPGIKGFVGSGTAAQVRSSSRAPPILRPISTLFALDRSSSGPRPAAHQRARRWTASSAWSGAGSRSTRWIRR
jgi:hypothetical protein